MNRIIIDGELRSRLDNLDSQMELCDESGRILGYYVPAAVCDPSLHQWARDQFTEKEIDRARAEPGGLSIGEVLDGLDDR